MDHEVIDEVRLTAAVDHPHRQFLGFGRHARQVGFAADGGERVDVDGGPVGYVVVASCRPLGIARLVTCHLDTSGALGMRMPCQGVTTTCPTPAARSSSDWTSWVVSTPSLAGTWVPPGTVP
jgi:hypothetical protein